ncbi:DUF4007 family protein [Shewanella gaetbuli]
MKAKFTGHDTFPLRYGWLHKAANYLNFDGSFQTSNEENTRNAIVKLGVGKNMVNAMRYWAEASSIIKATTKNNSTFHEMTKFGALVFGDRDEEGKDPYLENIGSIWLLHFHLNYNIELLTSYRYFFNYSNVQHFEKSKLLDDCSEVVQKMINNEIGNKSTLKKDIDCFLNTYSKKFKTVNSKKKTEVDEDHFTSPLSELNLIQDNGGGFYVSDLTERPDLPVEVFIYALAKFASQETVLSNVTNIDFESLLSKPNSPGRIFRLSEAGLGQKLDEAQEYSKGDISWIDSLGLRQVQVSKVLMNNSLSLLEKYYSKVSS